MRPRIFTILLAWLCTACTALVPATPDPIFNPTFALPTPTPAPTAITLGAHFALRDLPGTGRNPTALAAMDAKIYVANAGTDNLAVIEDNRVTRFISVGNNPVALAVDPAQRRLYIANAGDKTVSLITDNQSTATQSLGETPRALLFFENRLFVGLDSKPNILVLDPATLQTQATIAIPNAFSIINLAGDAAQRRVYANVYEKTVVIDSTNLRVLSTLALKGSYFTIVPNPQANTIYLTNYEADTQSQFLIEMDPLSGAQKARVKISGDPRGAVMSADGSRVYMVNAYTSNVMAINTRAAAVTATIPVGRSPHPLALDENARRLYVGNSESDSVTAIDTDNHQVVATIPLGMNPTALIANEAAGRVYIANGSSNSVFVVEGTRVVKEIGVGSDPTDLALDAASNRVLVANQSDGTLSILSEPDLSVRATQPIAGYVTTVGLDAVRSRVFVNDVVLDSKNLAPSGRLTAQGLALNSIVTPSFVRVNPNNHRVYAIASNGVPGSNGRIITYSIDGDTLKQRATLPGSGNVLFFAIDPDNNRVYQVETHPLAFTHHLNAFDAEDKRVASLPLPARATGLLYNPQTHHLFVAHGGRSPREGPSQAADHSIQVYDVITFGELARLPLQRAGKMTRLGNTIYAASEDGTVTLIQDAVLPAPPAPTPTFTPTPYPSSTPAPAVPTTPAPRQPSATPRAGLNWATPVGFAFAQKWVGDLSARLGCPSESARNVNFVMEIFERGRMFYREDEKGIYAITDDRSWVAFDDKWPSALKFSL